MIVLYMHCQGCAWFWIVKDGQLWIPPIDGADPDADFYNASIFRMYIESYYYAILLLCANDIGPVGTLQVFVVCVCILMGAIANANIFGNMAVLISEMQRKNQEFQQIIDTSNTAMKNLKLPSDIHSRIVTYLNYTYDSMDQQKELKFFFDTMSPNLKDEVVRFIFA